MPGPYPLARLGAVIDENGITAPTFEDILQSMIAHFQLVYGSDAYLGADSMDYQWIAILSQIVYDNNQAVIAAYFSYSPTFAQGIGLTSVCKINGISRQPPTRSTVPVTLTGQVGTVITNGAVSDQNGLTMFDLPASVTIPATGEITVTAVARNVGSIRADSGTINRIATAQPGWQTVTNAEAALPGIALETDATLRRRQTVSVSLPAITPREAILGAVSQVLGAGQCKVYDNDTDMYDANGIPPHSISVVTEGGDALQIATQILYHKNVGCGTFGNQEITVFDQRGTPQVINFYYATFIDIYVTVVIRPLVGYLNTTGNLIRAAVARFIQGMEIGETIFNSWLYAPARLSGDLAVEATGLDQLALDRLSVTYSIERILVGTAPNPTEEIDMPVDFHSVTTAQIDYVDIRIG